MTEPMVILSKEDFESILSELGQALARSDPGTAHIIDVDWGETGLLGDIEVVEPTVTYTTKHCMVCAIEFDAYDGVCDCE